MARSRPLVCTTIGELADEGRFDIVQDPENLRRIIGRSGRGYDTFLVDPRTKETWGFKGKLTMPNKMACRIR